MCYTYSMMHSTVTKRGQTTIPRQIRDALHLRGGERLTYEIQDEGVLIKPHPGILANFGALKVPEDMLNVDFKTAREQALKSHAEEAAQEGVL